MKRGNKVKGKIKLSPKAEERADTVDSICGLEDETIDYMEVNRESDHNEFVRELHFPDTFDLDPDGLVGGVPDIYQTVAIYQQSRGCFAASLSD